MPTEQVRIWRPGDEARLLLMKGHTTRYTLQPRGECVFGIVTESPMRARRGREEWLVEPGQLVAWDPSDAHSGAAVDGHPWNARLMVVELAALAALAQDSESDVLSDIEFPEPVLADRDLAARFLRLHATLETTSTRLERDDHLAELLRDLVQHHASRRTAERPPTERDDRALRQALEYLTERFARNVTLDELADAAGIGKFRLIRIFRQRTGLAPHQLQIAHRIRRARRLLEDGETIAATAAATGFADQSHLHRHFQASIGWTPRQYQRRAKAH
ncbi:MAG TPA: AraC family transcriptional regulator [Candidatus Dormibacteraeota bacterium]|jgi:AraC-like DNA-binding protein|nr:AraC family transcriptional regulator [Candidatus Dormibacteraeota bacterium]